MRTGISQYPAGRRRAGNEQQSRETGREEQEERPSESVGSEQPPEKRVRAETTV